jgi:hypothetical protein
VRRLKLPAIALALALLYIVALHPMTGLPGGFVYLTLGWLIPSVINLLLSTWIALFFGIQWPGRAAILVVVSFLLGMNTLLPDLFKARPKPVSSSEIARVVRVTSGMVVDVGLMTPRLPDEVFYTQAPSALGVSVSTDGAACGCMWFTDARSPSTEQQVWDVISAKVHRSEIGGPLYIGSGNMALGGVHFDVRFMRSATPGKTVNLLITLYDGWNVTAVFKQADIPISDAIQTGIHAPGLRVDRFYQNALGMLVRHNFWVFILESRMAGFSPEPLRRFLDDAVDVQ